MDDEELQRRAQAYLMRVSDDDCWIDATSGYAIDELVKLLKDVIKDSQVS